MMATTPPTPVDLKYFPSREDTLTLEDSRFLALLSGIPNSYPTLNDSSIFGSFLRALAMEMTRLEYDYAYDLTGLTPSSLTPPDIKRRFAAPLDVNKGFPTPAQTDQDYRNMIVGLLDAFLLGGTVAGIEAVIEAMTGQSATVVELYRLIGNGIYDQSDRNALSVTLPLVGAAPLNSVTTASRIEILAQSLYAAIDLIKPAHVGVRYAVSVGSDDDLGSLVLGATDTFFPHYMLSEPSPLGQPLILAPMIDADSPQTTLGQMTTPANVLYPAPIAESAFSTTVPTALQFLFTFNTETGYSLNPAYANYPLVPGIPNGLGGTTPNALVPDGEGLLSPQVINSWIITSDTLTVYQL